MTAELQPLTKICYEFKSCDRYRDMYIYRYRIYFQLNISHIHFKIPLQGHSNVIIKLFNTMQWRREGGKDVRLFCFIFYLCELMFHSQQLFLSTYIINYSHTYVFSILFCMFCFSLSHFHI